MIPFNRACLTGSEEKFVIDAIRSKSISGDAQYSARVQAWFETALNSYRALLTPSCTASLEMAAILLNIEPGDEVILPSYTFVSTANAFILRGATLKFIDIRPDTMNMDESLIEAAITPKTKAIVPVHYAGVACAMDEIMSIAERHNLYVIEDAAQAMLSTYKGRQLGSIGHIGAFSFHETKNFTSAGEGGLTIINDPSFIERAEIVREKGTNRKQFFRGQVDKYSWVDVGSSFLMNDVSAAYLWGQINEADSIIAARRRIFNRYYEGLQSLQQTEHIQLSIAPGTNTCNAHMFYIKTQNNAVRQKLIAYLKDQKITSVFHYIPLHSSTMGQKAGAFVGTDVYTTVESEKLLRLPMYYGLKDSQIDLIVSAIADFYRD
jgi:dTDP-4-amino-4,6-dideoxygalactose transaminase